MTENNSTLAPAVFTADQVTQLTGVSYRQLDYWMSTRLIPHDDPKPGTGNLRLFTYGQLVFIAALAQAVKAGLGPRRAADLVILGTITHRAVTITIDITKVADTIREAQHDQA